MRFCQAADHDTTSYQAAPANRYARHRLTWYSLYKHLILVALKK
jgi:hypothetical protein